MNSATKDDKKDFSRKRVAVIGAGVSGLSAAYKLKLQGLNVTVFEADGRAGGKLKTVAHDGLIWDEGANTMTESEADVGFLLDNLGLREKQQFPISQHKRYIAKNGSPVMLPSNPIELIRSNFLSSGSKLQLLLEPFLWKKNNISTGPDTWESVGSFFQRHFGKEVVDYLIDPFVAGTSGGDPESLSMHHVFPELWNLEQRFGSIIAGAFLSKLSSKKDTSGGMKNSSGKKLKRGSFSFLGGMQTLTDALCDVLDKEELKLQSKVLELSSSCNEHSPLDNWSVSYESDGKKLIDEKSFDALVVTVSYIPISVIITTFKREFVKRPLEGFGILVPSKEQENGLKTLGTLFSSMMFPDRAPSDVHLYTTFVGGSRNRELAKASRDELEQIVTSDLKQLLGAEGEPTFLNHYYWSRGFPLYGHGYNSVIEAIGKMEKDLPGFFYAGNHKGGLSVGKAISSGCHAADLVISYLEASSNAQLKLAAS
ncbi:protoporphyrinogen oxidase, mitochondrial-like isoform X2 [Primulina huaijiensis]|uniref:protoporphyrinogen oxidase, mitochondrial-like isoform X2 n=1 Tax=Primulina huaijiensis TaxID=1492673 RepID=UPI003CC76D21